MTGNISASTAWLNSLKQASKQTTAFWKSSLGDFCPFVFNDKFLSKAAAFLNSHIQPKKLVDFLLLLSSKYFAGCFTMPLLLM